MNKDWVQTTKDMSAALKQLRGGAPAVMQGFSAIAQAALKANALDTKTKELIALAIAVATRCDGCIAFHAEAAVKQGASREEVLETMGMAIYMGAGPSVMYAAQALEAFDQFQDSKTLAYYGLLGSCLEMMTTMSTAPDWLHSLPALASLDSEAFDLLARAATKVDVKAGTVLFRPGDACSSFLIVLSGSVRVQLLSEAGREIVLYRVGTGSTCVLTTSCLIGNEGYGAEGIAETVVSAVSLPKDSFDRLITRSTAFRDFVFQSFGARLTDLMKLVSEVAFGRIDGRLAEALISHAPQGGPVALTHQALAVELGTAREVISRHLKDFQRRGLVDLGRGHLEVLNVSGLRDLAASPSSAGCSVT